MRRYARWWPHAVAVLGAGVDLIVAGGRTQYAGLVTVLAATAFVAGTGAVVVGVFEALLMTEGPTQLWIRTAIAAFASLIGVLVGRNAGPQAALAVLLAVEATLGAHWVAHRGMGRLVERLQD